MLAHLSETLRFMLRSEGDASDPPLLQDVEVSFDRPSEGFIPTPATINLFLYELHEDVELRSNETDRSYTTDGRVQQRRPPLRVDCSYLMTAWPAAGQPNSALEELRLLGEAIQVLARHELIPANYRQGTLKAMEPPPRLHLAAASTERGRSLAELWTALGNRLRPSVLLRVTLAIDANPVPAPDQDFLVTSTGMGIHQMDQQTPIPFVSPGQRFFSASGRITRSGQALPGALVSLIKLQRSAETDADGVFRFGSLPPGTYDAAAAAQGLDGKIQQKLFQLTVPLVQDDLVFLDFAN